MVVSIFLLVIIMIIRVDLIDKITFDIWTRVVDFLSDECYMVQEELLQI